MAVIEKAKVAVGQTASTAQDINTAEFSPELRGAVDEQRLRPPEVRIADATPVMGRTPDPRNLLEQFMDPQPKFGALPGSRYTPDPPPGYSRAFNVSQDISPLSTVDKTAWLVVEVENFSAFKDHPIGKGPDVTNYGDGKISAYELKEYLLEVEKQQQMMKSVMDPSLPPTAVALPGIDIRTAPPAELMIRTRLGFDPTRDVTQEQVKAQFDKNQAILDFGKALLQPHPSGETFFDAIGGKGIDGIARRGGSLLSKKDMEIAAREGRELAQAGQASDIALLEKKLAGGTPANQVAELRESLKVVQKENVKADIRGASIVDAGTAFIKETEALVYQKSHPEYREKVRPDGLISKDEAAQLVAECKNQEKWLASRITKGGPNATALPPLTLSESNLPEARERIANGFDPEKPVTNKELQLQLAKTRAMGRFGETLLTEDASGESLFRKVAMKSQDAGLNYFLVGACLSVKDLQAATQEYQQVKSEKGVAAAQKTPAGELMRWNR